VKGSWSGCLGRTPPAAGTWGKSEEAGGGERGPGKAAANLPGCSKPPASPPPWQVVTLHTTERRLSPRLPPEQVQVVPSVASWGQMRAS
jgi:hypothetical protein